MEDTQNTNQSTSMDEAQRMSVIESDNPPPEHPIEYWEERLLGKKLYPDDVEIPPGEREVIVFALSSALR